MKDIPIGAVVGIALVVVGAFSVASVLMGHNGQLISATYAIIGGLVGYGIAKKKEKDEQAENE
jgi:outer membrane lipoprotein SlyB